MYNKIILIGRLTADPEMRFTPSGVPVAKFTLAVNRTFSNKQGEKEADFLDIVVWRALAETCSNYLKKGYMAAVDGRLQIRSYDDNQGVRRKVAEVIAENIRFLDRGKDSQHSPAAGGQQAGGYKSASKKSDEFSEVPFTEDDLPF
ncbi:MAG: single-stranded DNA-binding protein [Desulfocucumaceae bacterium]